jgi:hypothetical protein
VGGASRRHRGRALRRQAHPGWRVAGEASPRFPRFLGLDSPVEAAYTSAAQDLPGAAKENRPGDTRSRGISFGAISFGSQDPVRETGGERGPTPSEDPSHGVLEEEASPHGHEWPSELSELISTRM